MLGWHISVYRQADKGTSPAEKDSPHGERLAVWQADVGGLDWLHELVRQGKAIDLGGNGYPCRYSAPARYIIPRLAGELPHARSPWIHEPTDILGEKWEGKTTVDRATTAACRPDEWLLVEAWDES